MVMMYDCMVVNAMKLVFAVLNSTVLVPTHEMVHTSWLMSSERQLFDAYPRMMVVYDALDGSLMKLPKQRMSGEGLSAAVVLDYLWMMVWGERTCCDDEWRLQAGQQRLRRYHSLEKRSHLQRMLGLLCVDPVQRVGLLLCLCL